MRNLYYINQIYVNCKTMVFLVCPWFVKDLNKTKTFDVCSVVFDQMMRRKTKWYLVYHEL